MAQTNTTATGTLTVSATQLARRYTQITVNGGATGIFGPLLTRGAPRVLVWLRQSAGVAGASVAVQAAVSDSSVATQPDFFTLTTLVAPPGAPLTFDLPIPTKYLRLLVTAPVGVNVNIEAVIMVAQ